MTDTTPTPKTDWRDKYPDIKVATQSKSFVLEDSTDDSELNRMIQLRQFDNKKLVEGKPGRLYFDKENRKVKLFIDEATGWVDLDYTSPTP